MATIKDVSKLANVSVGTVSRYLNGYTIKSDNATKIEAAIKALNFKLNPIARSLKTSKTKTIGILIPELNNVFTNEVINAIEKTFASYDYSVIVCNSRRDVDIEKSKINFLINNFVDGIIMMPVSNESKYINKLLAANIPVVLIDRLIPDILCDAVICDNINGSYTALEYLINRGHKKIGIILGPSEVFTSNERLTGYKKALAHYNIPLNPDYVIETNYTVTDGLNAFNTLFELEDRPTAIFATNYDTTIGAIKALFQRKLKLNEEMSLFGYDHTDIFQILNPPIPVISQPKDEIGLEAADLLLKRINGDYSDFPSVQRLKTDILIHE